MKQVSNKRKMAAKKALNASKAAKKTARKVLGLNSSKQIESEWYYSIADIETVVASILAELDTDPGAGITLESSDTGITLNVISSEGEEYTVDVELTAEGDEASDAATEDEPAEDEPTEE